MSLKKKLQNKLLNNRNKTKAKTKKKSEGSTKLSVFASAELLDSEPAKSRTVDSSSNLEYPNSPPWIHFT